MTIANPLVTVVLPVLNGEQFICDAIDNCLTQSLRSLEVIVVDGGSTDRTLDLCRTFVDERVRIVQQESNNDRLPGALNLGCSVARGEYLTWTHDDNLYSPDALERMVIELEENPDAGLVYSDYWLVNRDLSPIRKVSVSDPRDLVIRNCIGPCFLYRYDVYREIGDYDPDTFLQEDYDYWIRVTSRYNSLVLHRPLYFYRVHGASLTGRYRRQMFDQFVRIRDRSFPASRLISRRSALAEWYMSWAFEDHLSGRHPEACLSALNGIIRRPRFLLNPGVLKILHSALVSVFR